MGCKSAEEQKDEEKNEIKKSVIDLLKEEGEDKKDEKDKKGSGSEFRDIDFYQNKFANEEKNLIEKLTSPDNINNYSKLMFEKINEIRQDPYKYANYIEDSMEYILEKPPDKAYFNRLLKVRLHKGEAGFRNAAKVLKSIDPLPVLRFKEDLCIPLPHSEAELMDKNYFKKQIAIMRTNRKVDAYFKDMIKFPEVSALLLMVDDNKKDEYIGKRREIILRKEFQYIGISSGIVNDIFVAYFTFSR
jgi:hypothetical protein